MLRCVVLCESYFYIKVPCYYVAFLKTFIKGVCTTLARKAGLILL